MTPSGTLVEFSSGLTHDGAPQDIDAGTDGNLYFTENKAGGELGRITPAGVITEYTTGLSAAPYGIARGGDGNMWFTENGGKAVGRLTIAPAATTQSPLATSATSATLAGAVTPNAQATTYVFQWGPTTAYGTTTSVTSAGSGSTQQVASTAISGLTAAATYHYRIVATNASGTTTGQDVTFVAQSAPIVATGVAGPVGQASVTLNAIVDPNGLATSYHFEWGATTGYGQSVPSIDAAVGSDSTDHLVSQTVVGLSPGTTYHVRVVATSSWGDRLGRRQHLHDGVSPAGGDDRRREPGRPDRCDAERERRPERLAHDVPLRRRAHRRLRQPVAGLGRHRRCGQLRARADGRPLRSSIPAPATTSGSWARAQRASPTAPTRRSRRSRRMPSPAAGCRGASRSRAGHADAAAGEPPALRAVGNGRCRLRHRAGAAARQRHLPSADARLDRAARHDDRRERRDHQAHERPRPRRKAAAGNLLGRLLLGEPGDAMRTQPPCWR